MYGELFAIARELAMRDAGRPKKESLARAISTAYYAVFHALAEFCSREMIGAWAPWQPFRHVYRSLDHGNARKVFEGLRGSADFGQDIKLFGEAFLLLQRLRHAADYDPGYRTARREALNLIERAEEAVRLLGQLSPAERKLLAARLIGRARTT